MPEPTCLAAIALRAHSYDTAFVLKSLDHVESWQVKSGAVLVSAETPAATWPTALAALGWGTSSGSRYRNHRRAAIAYLLGNEGQTFKSDPRIYGHDTQLVGWPWIEDTHTWIEPTSYALLALRAAGQADHPRVHEALKAVYNRAIPTGGWNYGNGRMFVNDLRSFPSTTGMALTALSGRAKDETIAGAIEFLHSELPNVRSMFSLAWGIIGLRSWDEVPTEAETWMARAVAEDRPEPASPLEDALMLIAVAEENPFGNQALSEQAAMSEAEASVG